MGGRERAMLGVTVNGDAPKAAVHPPAALRLSEL